MMERGSYGYSIPVFPSHTPVNFASLFTGVSPIKHGVADGPIRQWGYPLSLISTSGFSSIAKTIDPLWTFLERAGLVTTLLSVPGSTPPEISNGSVIKGRWGGWGVEFPAIIFHTRDDAALRRQIGWNDRVFSVEKKLTEFVSATDPVGWGVALPNSFSPVREARLNNWGRDVFMLLTDSTDDGRENYDGASFSLDKKKFQFSLKEGQWSEWFNLRLRYELSRQFNKDAPRKLEIEEKLSAIEFDTPTRLKVIKLGAKDFFRVRVLYGGLNESVATPQAIAETLTRAAGPMVDFVDNYPPQLVYVPEDKPTFLEEATMSFDWHEKAASKIFQDVRQDVFVHSIYTPNQMLTSRWWMGHLDPRAKKYHEASDADRATAKKEVLAMYRRIDDMLGEAMSRLGPDAYLVFSSDHGAAPLNFEVRLNNFFAKQGWLKFDQAGESGGHEIDWRRTKVIFLNMNHVFINPRGLGGVYNPARGPEYEKLRDDVIAALRSLKDAEGNSPVAGLLPRSEASKWGLPEDRVGDLVLANALGYNWVEDVSDDGEVFASSLKAGYKQAILPDRESALWTPFVIVGPGVKKGHAISRPISHLEQLPTLLQLMKIPSPYAMDRAPLNEIFVTIDNSAARGISEKDPKGGAK